MLIANPILAQRPAVEPTIPPDKIHFDPKQPIPKIGCLLSDGKFRTYPCEFIATKLIVVNNSEPALKSIAWGKQSMTLYVSKAQSFQDIVKEGKIFRQYTCDLSLTLLRIAFPVKTVSTFVMTMDPRAKGTASTLLGDLTPPSGPTKPPAWPASAEPALSTPVGQEQTITVPVKLLIDSSALDGPLFVTNSFGLVEKAASIDLRI